MTARAGMATLINDLRAACAAGTADYLLGTVPYWTDDQLQAELDRTQRIYHYLVLKPIPEYINGQMQWFQYGVPEQLGTYLEEDGSGTGGWAVKDNSGGTIPIGNYAVNYQAGLVTFPSDQKGSVYFLDARTYNLNRAAANVWRWKASRVANRVDWSSDNHKISASQERQTALEMATYYSGIAGPVSSVFVRTDEA